MCFFIKLGRYVRHGERMNPIDFGGQRSKVKVTMDVYGNKLVNMIETKLLCISLSNLADMLTMVNPIDLEVTVQRWRSPWVSLTNVGCAGMLRFVLLYYIEETRWVLIHFLVVFHWWQMTIRTPPHLAQPVVFFQLKNCRAICVIFL